MATMPPPTFDSAVIPDASSEMMVRELYDHLRDTQQRQLLCRAALGLSVMFTMVAVCLAASAMLDWYFELTTTWRAAWVGVVAAVAGVATILGWRNWILAYTLTDTAVDSENRLSQFGQRLRTTLDYGVRIPQPAAASPVLLHSLQQETFHLARQTDWSAAIDGRPLRKGLFLASSVAMAWMLALMILPGFRIAAARAILFPIEYTTVTFSPLTDSVRPGESVTITATVNGRSVSTAHVRYRSAGTSEAWETANLLPPGSDESEFGDDSSTRELSGELSTTLLNLQRDIEFDVVAGPRPLPPGLIRVLQPLTLESCEALITPPAYTGRPAETATTLNLKVLEGSNVELTLEFSRPAAEVRLTGLSSEDSGSFMSPLMLRDNRAFASLMDLRRSVSWMLNARTADGMLLEEQEIHIRVQPDRRPQVRFVEPPEELVVTPTTEVPFLVEADDDLGLHKVGVMFQIGSGPMQILMEREFEQEEQQSVEPVRLSTMMMLEDHQLTLQDAVTYYAFAEDNYFGQPRRTVTPLRFIDIRPYKIEFQVTEGEGTCDGSSVTLEELIARQRHALTQAFQALQQPVSREIANRLLEFQEPLLSDTREFSMGMAERGASLTSLDEAAAQIVFAIEALKAVNLPAAIAAEQEALAAMIRARENLRKILKQSSGQSASSQRQFDRQQRQKLRMPPKSETNEQEQVAQLRKQLDDLAKREREWANLAQQCCSTGNSSGSPSPLPSQSNSASPPSNSSAAKPAEENPSDFDSPESRSAESNDAKNESSEPSESSGAPSPSEVAAVQEAIQSELADLQAQLDRLAGAGQGARQQARQAAESMKDGLEALRQEDGDSAAREGERSAEQLEELSDHLAAMSAQDFGKRLDHARRLAQQLVLRQEVIEQSMREQAKSDATGSGPAAASFSGSNRDGPLGDAAEQATASGRQPRPNRDGNSLGTSPGRESGLARDQRALATQTEMLGELLQRLERDALGEAGGVQQELQQSLAENPPREIADRMLRAAADLESRRVEVAGRGAAESLERLRELHKSLGIAQHEYSQPQLKELLVLEEQLAQLQEQMRQAPGKPDDAAADAARKWQQLEPRLDAISAADRRIAEAMRQLRDDPEGFYSWLERGNLSGFREVSKALQAKIQEAILAGAILDSDQPIPPQYKELVEKYYRALSDDLR